MILRDFHCDACNVRFEDYVSSGDDRFAACPKCGVPCELVLSAPRVGVYNDPAAKNAALKKRSHDHSMREMKREPEKYGFKAGDKRPWNLRSSTKPSS